MYFLWEKLNGTEKHCWLKKRWEGRKFERPKTRISSEQLADMSSLGIMITLYFVLCSNLNNQASGRDVVPTPCCLDGLGRNTQIYKNKD